MLVYLTATVGMFVIWFVWFPVVRARHRIVDYYKFSSEFSEVERSKLCSEDEYVQSSAKRTAANERFKLKTNWRKTRIKLDIGMPVLFTIVWMALVFSKAFEL